ncbi:hypothetical protein PVAG01_04817 [Phlyctema vagabunda]|uniref:AAA+ ATPase domain-containing protein n=1 Tax=Phlyctema vagabunda TaxID=108571 RepID=A0ABR4PIE2_9HELO
MEPNVAITDELREVQAIRLRHVQARQQQMQTSQRKQQQMEMLKQQEREEQLHRDARMQIEAIKSARKQGIKQELITPSQLHYWDDDTYLNRDITNHTISEDRTASSGFSMQRLSALGPGTPEEPTPKLYQGFSPVHAQGGTIFPPINAQGSSTSLGIQRQALWPKVVGRESGPQRISVSSPIDFDQKTAPDISSTMEIALSGGQYGTSSSAKGAGSGVKSEICSASSSDQDLLGSLRQEIEELEEKNRNLEQRLQMEAAHRSEQIPPIKTQIFHCLDKGDTFYLSEPVWEIHDEEADLRGRFPIADPEAYIENAGNVAFIVYKYYDIDHQRGQLDEAIKKNQPLPPPEPAQQSVLLRSKEMIGAIEAFFAQLPDFRDEFANVNAEAPMDAPFVWWYHYRKSYKTQNLPYRTAQLVTALLEWIEDNYSVLYDRVENQFDRGKVSGTSMEYLIRPGEVLVKYIDDVPMGLRAISSPSLGALHESTPAMSAIKSPQQQKANKQQKLPYRWTWSIKSYSYVYKGEFVQLNEILQVTFETEGEDEEIDISSLEIMPLKYATLGVREILEQRGKTFWKCRHQQLISYGGDATSRKHPGQRFMVDFNTYTELHPSNKYQPSNTASKMTKLPSDGDIPQAPDIYLFPTMVPGFDLRRKKWTDLQVDQIRDVTWNEQAFSTLVADDDTKLLIQALVTSQLAADNGTDLIENKGNGLIMLLHGSPGTGKTFTAESVAEIAKKPLYPVTCGDIGTKPEEVEKYLESVFHLGKIWDCVVLLDEAEVFLEQRTLNDLKRNALVSVFLRALEYYEGILILTTNRVGTFDEAFKSRIQLALRYENLDKHQRKQIWRNFIKRLRSLGEERSIDFDDVGLHIEDLAELPMNGRQIRNSITTARQLAQFEKRKMTYSHLQRTINVSKKFDKYLSDVREQRVEEPNQMVDGRYTDDFIAREEQIR